MARTISEDYSGRQVDLESLQHVAVPVGVHSMSMSSSGGGARKVAGIQKAVQRYVSLLLTPGSTKRFGGVEDNVLLSSLVQGVVSNEGYLRHLFVLSSSAVLDVMRDDDYNSETYGDTPDDERIRNATFLSASVDAASGTVSLSVEFETYAGESYTYIVPIRTGK